MCNFALMNSRSKKCSIRHDEHDGYKKHLNDLKRAKLSDLFETYTPIDVTFDEIGKRIAHQIKGLCRKYPVEQRRKTNLLFYFNLHDTFFDPAEQVGRFFAERELAISIGRGQQLGIRVCLINLSSAIH